MYCTASPAPCCVVLRCLRRGRCYLLEICRSRPDLATARLPQVGMCSKGEVLYNIGRLRISKDPSVPPCDPLVHATQGFGDDNCPMRFWPTAACASGSLLGVEDALFRP